MNKTLIRMARLCIGVGAVLSTYQMKASAPTDGLTQYSDTYTVQKPYDLNVSDRFSASNGQYACWIYSTDKPFSQGSGTGPRTEMRWASNWTSGRRAWEADVLIQSGSEHTCVMQVKSNDGYEPIYVNVHSSGNLYNDNDSTVLASGVWGKWVHIATDYNTSNGVGHVYINGSLKYTRTQKVSTTWYFKNGVYNTDKYSKATFKNLKMWK